MAVIITSYSESNQDDFRNLNNALQFIGEAFAVPAGPSYTLDSCKFYLQKTATPTGNCTAKVYASTGSLGTTAVPTGAALATSDNFDISTISSVAFALYTFSFSGGNRITLNASTNYCVVLNTPTTDGTNRIKFGTDSSSPSYAGNLFTGNDPTPTGWTASATEDGCFYVYGISNVVTTGNFFNVF